MTTALVPLAQSSPPEKKRGRGFGRPFQKGRSGNPGGQKKQAALRALARDYTEEAIKTLVKALKDSDGRVRVAAANSLLDRGWGKPSTEIDVYLSVQRELEGKSDAELIAIAATAESDS